MDIKTILTRRLSELSLTEEQVIQIQIYIEFLLKANRKISLTRIGDFHQWFISHVEDSIKAYGVFSTLKASKFIDCGSGNGLPGVIFGVLSGLPFTLCDVDQRKCEFLKSACFKLGLKGDVFSGPAIELADKQIPGACFVYRGLGPDNILSEQFVATTNYSHFRFISATQTQLFAGSAVKKYELSDKSERFLEIYQK